MRSGTLKVVRNREIAASTYELTLSGSLVLDIKTAGTFLHIQLPGNDSVLRRPISIASVNDELETCTLIYKVTGDGTQRLTTARPNDVLNVLGPLGGQGFPVEQPGKNDEVLLIGGGVGVPPMYYTARLLEKRGISFSVILGFASADAVFYEKQFNELAAKHVTIMTDDGSRGKRGTVVDAIGMQIRRPDWMFTCGPRGMLRAVKAAAHPETRCYVSLEEHMGCGIGACFACVCETEDRTSYYKICQDGPVFAAEEVLI